ncbi:hypothetical protein DACRYDRAFT_94635 [Dacryopinax primogenitus]|uniref:Uncharacterized protein n=1 Tax=Dacryopinax primogenitus (strain DJM 731) TaxID=1858805 RepID=M5G202_DACPD|nr:uncharacterized protein DACRYDRAFT_94635 [Dacryopinax primogenitus]EJU02245.1 hypothetical protein DACRYDRAFT_94635 [Dacryopinax primogenitus]
MREMIAETKGFYVRDWSLGLGWSQMRFIIQAAVLQADLLNRTLVLPSFVYARECEFNAAACSAFAEFMDRDGTLGYGGHTGRDGWKIPLGVMIDLPNLRSRHSVLLYSEFYPLFGLSVSTENWSGTFNRLSLMNTGLSLYTVGSHLYEPVDTMRVDKLVKPPTLWEGGTELGEKVRKRLQQTIGGGGALDWDDTKIQLSGGPIDVGHDWEIQKALNEAGSAVVYSFKGELRMDFVKSVVHPTKQVGFSSALSGFIEEFGHVWQDVLHMEGELHLWRKSGGMRFTTQAAMEDYQRTAVWDLRPPMPFINLAAKLDQRMRAVNQGRLWLGGHMRRRDMVQLAWVMENALPTHIRRIKDKLTHSLDIIRQVRNSHDILPYEVPGVIPNREILDSSPPLGNDQIFLATDAQDETSVKLLHSTGVVLLSDLLTPADRASLGHFAQYLMFGDVQAVLEHELLARAAFYYGHAISAASGVILEARARAGIDRRLAQID